MRRAAGRGFPFLQNHSFTKKAVNIKSFLLKSVLASGVSSLTVVALNVFLEMARGNRFFRFRHIFEASLYYSLFGILAGLGLGVIFSLYFFVKRKKPALTLPGLTYIYLFFAVWLLVFGYVNYYSLPLLLSSESIFWNSVIIICGIVLFIMARYVKLKRYHLFFKIHVTMLICLLLSSLIAYSTYALSLRRARNHSADWGTGQYNVLLLLLDAVRSDHLGCYGYTRNTTPRIDELASRGFLFENAFSASSQTLESVASLFTSTYPSTHKVRTFSHALPGQILTIPQVFKLHGYKTALFSSLGVVSDSYGYDRGVDDYFGVKTHLIFHTIPFFTIQKIDLLDLPVLSPIAKWMLRLSDALITFRHPAAPSDPAQLTQSVISWITENKDERFFIYAHFQGGHAPYGAPEPYSGLFDPDYPKVPMANSPKRQGVFAPFMEGKELAERDLENLIAQYDGEIFYHDVNIGILLDHLTDLGLDKKTIILVTADHGEEFYDHKGWGHGHSLYDEMIHIPLVICVPEVIPKSRRIKGLVSAVDIFPTILGLCGISKNFSFPYRIAGIDLAQSLLNGVPIQHREHIFAELYGGGQSARCLRTESYKALQVEYGKKLALMLFNLEVDPEERKNVYDEEKGKAAELFAMMESEVSKAKKNSFRPRKTSIDEKLKEHLRSLGYLE